MSGAPIAQRVLERMRRPVRSKVVDLSTIRAGNELAGTRQRAEGPANDS